MQKIDKSNALVTAIALVGIAALLLSNPRCRHGCRTTAEHLFEHGLKVLFADIHP